MPNAMMQKPNIVDYREYCKAVIASRKRPLQYDDWVAMGEPISPTGQET